jgi:hypothetical protein
MKNKNQYIFIPIIILLIGVIFHLSQKPNEITRGSGLKTINNTLRIENDSLKNEYIKIDSLILGIRKERVLKDLVLKKNEALINKLKNKKNETNYYVNSLSANDVADDFSKYLEERK